MVPLASFVTGRRSKFVVILLWFLLLIPMGFILGPQLADKIDDSFESQLPADTQSTRVFELQADRFETGQTLTGLVVYERKGGLTDADKARISGDIEKAKKAIPLKTDVVDPFGPDAPPGAVSEDGSVATLFLATANDFTKGGEWGKDLREALGSGEQADGLNVYVTGGLGLFADFTAVFEDFDGKLAGATALLVLILLLAIYRSVILPFIPIVVVAISYFIALGFVYLLAEGGATITGNVSFILPVLMFGVGTDYCLLLVSRYREELHTHEDKHEAMERALTRSGPAIVASGLTVIVSLLVLLFADVGGIRALGPSCAIAVALALLAGVTLLPALLTVLGRVAFWPRKRLVAYNPTAETAARRGIWRRVGDRVLQRPAAALALTLVVFGAGALGLLAYEEDYSTTSFFKDEVESVAGLEALERALPGGAVDPTTILIVRDGQPVTPADVEAISQRLEGRDKIASVTPAERSTDDEIQAINVVFEDDPYSDRAIASIPDIRAQVGDSVPGAEVLVGGGTATQYDFDKANDRDLKVIVPLALLVIAIILGVLLRAVVAPIVLIISVMISFFGTLGLGILFFTKVVGDPGIDGGLPTFAFIFLVALGVDYTIFLMSRVREEATIHGTREGMLRALTATGPVITSAGIILAGTFSVLMTLPVTFAFNIGFLVAVGILLDTFVVRTIMVPAAVELLGDKIWWPSTETGGGGALREHTDDHGEAAREAVAASNP